MNNREHQLLARLHDGEATREDAKAARALLETQEGRREMAELDRLGEHLRELGASTEDTDGEKAWRSVRSELSDSSRPTQAQAHQKGWFAATGLAGGAVAAAIALTAVFNGPASDEPSAATFAAEKTTAASPSVVEFAGSDLELEGSVIFVDEPSGWQIVWVIEADDPV
ncbi:MAG: hypothetical protein ACFB21_16655 [Opitutales bacterium]